MVARIGIIVVLVLALSAQEAANGCCPVYPIGIPVVNADQTVIILWDAANKTEHFIRQASFKGDADDFGFLIPSPTQPELEEAGNQAFPHLGRLTEPAPKYAGGGFNCTCCAPPSVMEERRSLEVTVLQEKLVAGFNAVVLEARSTAGLTKWLKENGYAFSPEVEAWAKPYVDAGWKITALKVVRSKEVPAKSDVKAAALRISFKTDRPLFPYREPDDKGDAGKLGAKDRLLRIYFLAEARYEGELTKQTPWTGKVAWAGVLSADDRAKILEELKLPPTTGPAEFYRSGRIVISHRRRRLRPCLRDDRAAPLADFAPPYETSGGDARHCRLPIVIRRAVPRKRAGLRSCPNHLPCIRRTLWPQESAVPADDRDRREAEPLQHGLHASGADDPPGPPVREMLPQERRQRPMGRAGEIGIHRHRQRAPAQARQHVERFERRKQMQQDIPREDQVEFLAAGFRQRQIVNR